MQYKTVSCLYREEEDKWRSRIKCESKERKNQREEAESSKEGVMWPLVPHERGSSNLYPFVWEERCFLGLFCVAWGHPTQTIYFVLCGVGSPHTDENILSYFCIIFLSLFPKFKRWWKQNSHLLFYQTHNLLHITHIVSPRVYKWVSYRFVPQVDLEDTVK